MITSTNSHVEAYGNGVTNVFQFTFPVTTSASHVEVFLAGVKQGSGYIVAPPAGQPDLKLGGTVTFIDALGGAKPPAVGTLVRIQRTVPLRQEMNLAAYSAFPAETIERTFDLAAMQAQQLQRQIDDHQVLVDLASGPVGPAGPTGPQGIQGPSGTGLGLGAVLVEPGANPAFLAQEGDTVGWSVQQVGTGDYQVSIGGLTVYAIVLVTPAPTSPTPNKDISASVTTQVGSVRVFTFDSAGVFVNTWFSLVLLKK